MWRSSCPDGALDALHIRGDHAVATCSLDTLHTSGIKSIVKGALTGNPGYKDSDQAKQMQYEWEQDWQLLLQNAKRLKSKEAQNNNQKMIQKLQHKIKHAQDYWKSKEEDAQAKRERAIRRKRDEDELIRKRERLKA
jgi:hypothetical protein